MMSKRKLIALFAFPVTYFAFAFTAWEMDVHEWDTLGRLYFVIVVGAVIGFTFIQDDKKGSGE